MTLTRLAALGLLFIVGCSPDRSAGQPPSTPSAVRHEVAIEGLAFVPDTVHASIGDTIIWTNRDIVPHTATAVDTAWDSELMAQAAVFSWVVTADGAGEYLCVFHPVMRGWILITSP